MLKCSQPAIPPEAWRGEVPKMAEVQTDFRTAEFVLADHAGTNKLRYGNEREGRRREEQGETD